MGLSPAAEAAVEEAVHLVLEALAREEVEAAHRRPRRAERR
jgi:hypothetical protein